MRQTIAFFSRFLLFIVIGSNAVLCSAAASNQDWLIQTVTGAVSVKGNIESTLSLNALPGSRLTPPFTIQTGTDGAVTLSRDQDKITVKPNAVTTVPRATSSETGVITRISQTLGTVFYQVQHRIKDRFEVETPYLVSVVKGTTFNILVTPTSSTVALIEGRVQVSTLDMKSQVLLEPGQTATKSKQSDDIIIKRQQTLSSPNQGPITISGEGTAQTEVTSDAILPPASLGGYSVPNAGLNATGNLAGTTTNVGASVDLGANIANGTSNLGATNIGISPIGANTGVAAGASAGTTGAAVNVGGATVIVDVPPIIPNVGGLLGL